NGAMLVTGGELYRLAVRVHHELRAPDAASLLAVEGLALEMLAEVLRARARDADRKPRWLDRAWQYLEARFAEPLTLAAVAQEVGVHPFHLARQFRRHFRCTVGERVRQLRVAYACRRLKVCDTPLVQIALAAGFAHQSHFARVFKSHTGMTPASFRDLARRR